MEQDISTSKETNLELIINLLSEYKNCLSAIIDCNDSKKKVEEQISRANEEIKEKPFISWEQADQLGENLQKLTTLESNIEEYESNLNDIKFRICKYLPLNGILIQIKTPSGNYYIKGDPDPNNSTISTEQEYQLMVKHTEITYNPKVVEA